MAALDTQGMQTCPATDSIPPGSCWCHWCCPTSGHRAQPGHSHLGLQPAPTAFCPEPWLGTEEQAPRGARTFQLLPCGHPSKQGSGELQPRGMGTSSPALCAAPSSLPSTGFPQQTSHPCRGCRTGPCPCPSTQLAPSLGSSAQSPRDPDPRPGPARDPRPYTDPRPGQQPPTTLWGAAGRGTGQIGGGAAQTGPNRAGTVHSPGLRQAALPAGPGTGARPGPGGAARPRWRVAGRMS